jgi:putative ABC transport system permease protein
MLRIALKNVLARKGRLFLSALGVIASCAFLSGVFVFSDTIQGTFDRLFVNAYRNTDAVVRSSNSLEAGFGVTVRDRVPSSLIDEIEALPGVVAADPDVGSTATMSKLDGTEIGVAGPPKFGGVYDGGPTSAWALAEGRAAESGSEVVIDRGSAKNGDLKVGDEVDVTTSVDTRRFTIVGIATFAGNDTSAAATWALFDQATAEEFVVGEVGKLDTVQVKSDGSMSDADFAESLQTALGGDVEVLSSAEITEENQSDVAESFEFINIFLTIFAGIATFVGCFIIYNVFKISAAQRLRENALMRAIGARSTQVIRSQLMEAVIIGVVGAILGFGAGVALAALILAGLEASGFGLGDAQLSIQPNSFIITFIVGVLVTVICAVFPAIRAGRTPPLAAMRDVAVDRTGNSKRRLIVGIVSVVASVLGVALGLSGQTMWLIVGVLGLFVAFVAFGPLVVGPVVGVVVKPLRKLRGVTGEIAARNAARSPERTALTAAALGICLALLIGVATLGASLRESFRDTLNEQFNGDIAITVDSPDGTGGIPVQALDEVLALDGVSNAVAFSGTGGLVDRNGEQAGEFIGLLNVEGAKALIDVPFIEGSWDAISGSNIGVSKDRAEADDLSVGDTIKVRFLSGEKDLTVAAIYDSDFLGAYGGDLSLGDTGDNRTLATVLAIAEPGVSNDQLKTIVSTVTDKYPVAKTQTRGEFIDDQFAQLGGFLNFVYALLMMSVFIAVLGIVLTLLLSVYERRRELGLVRAVGMTRGQVKASIRWESIVTAVFGALMGVGLGVALAWIVVRALRDQGLRTFAISPPSVVGFTLMAILFAVVAAWIPARRASKSNILEAIATT